MLSARRCVSVWSECACSLTSVAFILNRVAAPSMDGELVVMAGIKGVAQWWRPFVSHPSGACLLWLFGPLSGFLESVEVFVSVVQGEEKGKIVVPGSSLLCFTEKYYLPQAWCSIQAAAALDVKLHAAQRLSTSRLYVASSRYRLVLWPH